jgi:hypothetical protein
MSDEREEPGASPSNSEKKETMPSPQPASEQKEQGRVLDKEKRETGSLSHQAAKRWLQAIAWLINFIVPTIISILLGFSPLPTSVPLISFVQQHPLTSLLTGGIVTLVTVFTLFITYRPRLPAGKKPQWQLTKSSRPLIAVTALSMMSTLVCLALLLVVLLRPAWCPSRLCPPPQVLTNPNGVHTADLELYPIALARTPFVIQSPSFVIPVDPASYTEHTLPNSVGAVNLDVKQTAPYRIVLGVHSLQQGRFGLVIEQVALVIAQVPPMPRPLNVWSTPSTVNYSTNSYQVSYRGQGPQAVLPATYVSSPHGFVELVPGEADQFNVQISARFPVDIKFKVQISYRVTNESQMTVLTLPYVYEVVFSNNSNWHEYEFQSGHFVPVQPH